MEDPMAHFLVRDSAVENRLLLWVWMSWTRPFYCYMHVWIESCWHECWNHIQFPLVILSRRARQTMEYTHIPSIRTNSWYFLVCFKSSHTDDLYVANKFSNYFLFFIICLSRFLICFLWACLLRTEIKLSFLIVCMRAQIFYKNVHIYIYIYIYIYEHVHGF